MKLYISEWLVGFGLWRWFERSNYNG